MLATRELSKNITLLSKEILQDNGAVKLHCGTRINDEKSNS